MAAEVRKQGKRFFTVAEANKALPLVRAIVQDITDLARDLHERHDRLSRMNSKSRGGMDDAHGEELKHALADFERDQERMVEFEEELRSIGVELKDYLTGLVDFPCLMDGREVYLCWRLGETEIGHWHELDAGFAGRKKLLAPESRISQTSAKHRVADN